MDVSPLAFPETVTVIRQTVDAYGDTTAGASHEIEDCAAWPTTSTETVAGGQDVVIFGLTLWLPPGSDILSTDKVTVRGTTYDVNDQPALYKNPHTGTSGIEVLLTAATG